LVAGNNFVSIDGGGFSHWYYLINSRTGKIVSKQDKVELGLPSPPANFAYWYYHEAINTPQFIQESDIETLSLWAARFEKTFQPPVLLNNMLFIREGEGTLLGNVLALNRQTGDTVWETDNNVVSNVAVSDSTAFFLTSSAELIAIDVETGQKVGSLQFTNGETQLGEDRGYFVAASGGNVLVDLGDGRQLFAFRFLADE
jgi:outer membrane protein assembly factor BamB